ncbi:pilin [Saccharopolyspora sp. NPDC003762]
MRLTIPSCSHQFRPSPPALLRWRLCRRRAHRPSAHRWLLVGEIVAVGLLLTGAAAWAETTHVHAVAPTLEVVLTNARNWIMGILALVATVFLTVGGLRYLMAGGNPGEVEKAKQAFKSAGIGFGLTALAPVVVEILRGILGM